MKQYYNEVIPLQHQVSKKIDPLKKRHKQIEQKPKKQLGVMVIGAGFVARGYFEHFKNSTITRLAAIVDSNPEVLDKLSKEFNRELLMEDYKEALNLNEIDVVVPLFTSRNGYRGLEGGQRCHMREADSCFIERG